MVKAVLQGAYGGASKGVGGVGKWYGLVFGARSLTPAERRKRTFAIMAFMFLLLNGSAVHIVGGFWWLLQSAVMPLLNWPEGTAWWQATVEQSTLVQRLGAGLAFMILFGGFARYVWRGPAFVFAGAIWFGVISLITGFPWGSLPKLFAFDNIPFAIASLAWFVAAGWLFAQIVRMWKLAYKQLNEDLGQLLFKTFLVVAGEVMIVLVIIWFYNASYQLTPNFWVQVLAWSWQIPLGYFIGSGMNWLIENRERSGMVATRDQREAVPTYPDANQDGVPDNQEEHDHHDHTHDDGQTHR